MNDNLNSYRLVLVRTHFPGNLGACARIASNYDLRDTILVSPFISAHHSEAQRYATNAGGNYLENFKTTTNIKSALSDCAAAVGFTARDGVTRGATITLAEIAALAADRKVALVFGNEQDGLDTGELSACTHVCHLPTADIHRSLNLSHAVAIVTARLYEMQNEIEKVENQSGEVSNLESLYELFENWKVHLEIKSPKENNDPHRVMAHLRRIWGRAQLNSTEIQAMQMMLERLRE